jgi:UDP-glucuronate decarboxylase
MENLGGLPMKNEIVVKDVEHIFSQLSEEEKEKLSNSNILITGCAGFLGFYFMNFFVQQKKELGIKKIIGLDNFIVGNPEWLKKLEEETEDLKVYNFDISKDDIEKINGVAEVDFVIHMASIASPVFYRKYPIETLDANIWGLRKLFDYYKTKNIKGLLFFSSSEIYGDPSAENIPTNEEYRGNVSCIGPRACYDESKRFGETMCYLFWLEHKLPVSIARPFNNYGPGMKINDQRVPADFAKAILNNKDIVIYSSGSPTRTFCYVADAVAGYLKTMLHGECAYFNIGIDSPEISVSQLAQIYVNIGKKHFDYTGSVKFEVPQETDYLTHNPLRRCPDISKAKKVLGFKPTIKVEEGIERFLKFLKLENIK